MREAVLVFAGTILYDQRQRGAGECGRRMNLVPLRHLTAIHQDPVRLSAVAGWHEHIPFAFTLVDALRPRLFVELGTHRGDSYLAFCQAIKAGGVAAAAFAVDTWVGERHAGFYPEEIHAELKAYHDPLYGGFSTLLRSTFDEALARFGDGSIDLLHIDGLHTYEAVRHDYESWLPKLSEAGVVLLHDCNVRDQDFGVWKLWEEVSGRHPSFAFTHGHGLGVIAPGRAVPAALEGLFQAGPDEVAVLRRFYSLLGSRVALGALIVEKEREWARRLADADRRIAGQEGHIANLEQQARGLRDSLSWKLTKPLRSLNDLWSRRKS